MAIRRMELLKPDFMAQLERLSLLSRKPVQGWTAGQRRSRQAGHSVEFLDYRPYGAGDDLRYVDWNIFRRTDRMMVKQLVDDEELCLHLLVDASASMELVDAPDGFPSKRQWAVSLAAALAYIGLTSLERVGLGVMRDRVTEAWPPSRGRARVAPLFEFLAAVRGEGMTRLNDSLSKYAARSRGTGVLALISDLFDPSGCESGLKALLERRFEVHVIHLLSPSEMNPDFKGDLRLVDHETGETRTLLVDEETLLAYRLRLQSFLDGTETFCKAQGISYHRVSTAMPLEPFVLESLRGTLLA